MGTVSALLASPDGGGLGARLAALRVAAGLTQASLGDALGRSGSRIGAVERGRRLVDCGLVERWVRACGGAPEDVREAVVLIPEIVIPYSPE
jgi:transcriptional regulator with XRE-family HTH domain